MAPSIKIFEEDLLHFANELRDPLVIIINSEAVEIPPNPRYYSKDQVFLVSAFANLDLHILKLVPVPLRTCLSHYTGEFLPCFPIP